MMYRFMVALLAGAIYIYSPGVWAASCCGGGSSTSLILPKFSKSMVDLSFDFENYDGFWNQDGFVTPDPPESDLNQYRFNTGYAHRLGSNWQASLVVPYVWNQNTYAGLDSRTNDFGDTQVNLWYEAFETVMCVWKVNEWEDLMPAAYFGASLTLPTGTSPYNDVANSFDITGRGFYRLDANLLLDKTIYPWTATLLLSYGIYQERPVNREYGNYVEPYEKKLGDRQLASLSFGYTQFLDSMDSLTYTLAYSYLNEDQGTINGKTNYTSGFKKNAIGFTVTFSTLDNDWIFKGTYNHALDGDDYGRNFPITDIFTIGVTRVFR